MNIADLYEYCRNRPGVTEGFPFGEDVLVFRVAGKMFALVSLETRPMFVNLKCDPGRAVELRDRFEDIRPGYHMNKEHWNSVYLEGALDVRLVRELIDHSYDLVVASLTSKARAALAESLYNAPG